ncbi:MAG: glycine zipper 2TM domain-containing protein [Sulfuriferula sp.]|nr:glycine zipper 2TM domain-containing protein [Sulfuriferula sp.]
MNTSKLLAALMVSALTLTGCASGLGSSDYGRSQARTVQEVQMGVVQAVRNVKIEGTKSPVGSIAGAAVGGLAGSQLGGGNGQIVGAVLGAVLGGVGGSALEEKVTSQNGVEITVKLDTGRIIAITQGVEANEQFRIGDRVRILSGGGTTRVTY